MKCYFLDSKFNILTENADGNLYLLEAKDYRDIVKDWKGACDFVPSNDAKVYFASCDGKPLSSHSYTNFESLINYIMINERFYEAIDKFTDEQDFYQGLLDDGITVSDVEVAMGHETAYVMQKFCEEHGLIE